MYLFAFGAPSFSAAWNYFCVRLRNYFCNGTNFAPTLIVDMHVGTSVGSEYFLEKKFFEEMMEKVDLNIYKMGI